ncbi:hypothetical protein GW7_11018, partial [Heterocephalus glaber]
MTRKQEEYVVNVEQNVAEMCPRNPYCSNEEMQCGCRLHNVIIQPQMATGKPWSLWKMSLVCLLACLIASAIAVLVLYFGHFGKPTSNTTIIIHADGKSSQDPGVPAPTTPPAPSIPTGPQSIMPSTLTASQSTPTSVPTASLETTISITTTPTVHEVIIDEDYEE